MAALEISVNGTVRAVSADPDTSLLSWLRAELGLVGTRFGCGLGPCGACTVQVAERAVQSCQVPLWSVGASDVRTVEILSETDGGSRLQEKFVEHQAGQCGYCLSGILMTADAVLRQNPHPTEAEVRAALDRHLCRCGAHNRIVRAIMSASERP